VKVMSGGCSSPAADLGQPRWRLLRAVTVRQELQLAQRRLRALDGRRNVVVGRSPTPAGASVAEPGCVLISGLELSVLRSSMQPW